uniref:Uncharacterized protein n=1 Tax=Anguilla anguilla TaxID=7936 RepID=A0A0E9WC26_ANGAN
MLRSLVSPEDYSVHIS